MHYQETKKLKFGSVTVSFDVSVYTIIMVVLNGQGQAKPQVCGWPTEIEIGFVNSTTPSGQVRLGY